MRTLYDCRHARVRGEFIRCNRGYPFPGRNDGLVPLSRLEEGGRLCFAICECCKDFDQSGEPIRKRERGWNKHPAESAKGRPCPYKQIICQEGYCPSCEIYQNRRGVYSCGVREN